MVLARITANLCNKTVYTQTKDIGQVPAAAFLDRVGLRVRGPLCQGRSGVPKYLARDLPRAGPSRPHAASAARVTFCRCWPMTKVGDGVLSSGSPRSTDEAARQECMEHIDIPSQLYERVVTNISKRFLQEQGITELL
jgi:hypothetical protein